MTYLFSILDKILFILLLIGTGLLAKKMKWVSEQGEKDLTALMMNFIWPSLIFSSITTTLNAGDILGNLALPALSIALHVAGFAVGVVVCSLAGFQGDRRKIFLFNATMNNFLNMALPFAVYFFPEKGAALLAVANLGSMLAMWSLGVYVLTGSSGLVETVKNFLSPCLVSTMLAIALVLSGANALLPKLVTDVLGMVGQCTLFVGLMLAGTQIYKLGRKAVKFDLWNILTGLVRNIVLPALMFALALPLRGHVSAEALTVFMLVSMTPASANTITLAMRYGSSPLLAAESVIFTHILAIPTMLVFVALTERFILGL